MGKVNEIRAASVHKKSDEDYLTAWIFVQEIAASISDGIDIVMVSRGLVVDASRCFAELFANNVHVTRSFNPDSNRVWADPYDRHRHVIADQNLFAWLSREHQHTATPFMET